MSIKNIAIIVSIQLFFIANSSSQPLSADQIKTKLKAATVLITNNQQKIPAFFIADKILLTYARAIDNFIGTTMTLNLNNTIISVEFTNATPIENINHWTLIRLSGQNISSLIYEPLKFADQIPAYPSKIYNYIPFTSFLSNSIIDVRGRTIVTENQFFGEGRAGTPVVNNLGHVFGFFQDNIILSNNSEYGFLELTSFIKVFEKSGAKIVLTPIQNSNSGTITSTIPLAILRGPKVIKIFQPDKKHIVTFISPKHFVVPKSSFPNLDINVGLVYLDNTSITPITIKFKKVYEDPLSNICIMKVSFPSDFTYTNVPLSTTPVSVNTRVFSFMKEDYIRETTNDQNGGGFFSIGGYHALNSYIFNSQGQFAGLVMGEKNGRVLLRDVATIRQEIMQALLD